MLWFGFNTSLYLPIPLAISTSTPGQTPLTPSSSPSLHALTLHLCKSSTLQKCKICRIWVLYLGVEQIPNRTTNNCFLISIFFGSTSASILKKISQNRTKLQQNKQNKTKQTTIFLPKINKIFLSPILQNLKGRSVLDNFGQSRGMILSMSRKGSDGPKQKVLSFQEVGQKRKMVVKIELVYLPLSYSPCRPQHF